MKNYDAYSPTSICMKKLINHNNSRFLFFGIKVGSRAFLYDASR